MSPLAGAVLNIGGGSSIVLNDLLELLQTTVGRRAHVVHVDGQRGDVDHTAADVTRARRLLGFAPSVDLQEGVRRQVAWQRVATMDRLSEAG